MKNKERYSRINLIRGVIAMQKAQIETLEANLGYWLQEEGKMIAWLASQVNDLQPKRANSKQQVTTNKKRKK